MPHTDEMIERVGGRTSLGPNDFQPCGTDGARKRHAAHGDLCPACDPELEWTSRCPSCRVDVKAQGLVVLSHTVATLWLVEASRVCPGSGARVQPPEIRERPIWSAAERVRSAA